MASLHPNQVSYGYLTYCITAGVLTLLATVCVGLRFVQRLRNADLWWDDWTIVAALVFAIGVFITDILAALPSLGGAGYHINTYTIDQLNTWAKIDLASEVLYNPSITFSKVSMLLFYRRIFSVDGHFLLFMRIMMFLVVGTCLAAVFGLIFADNPVQAQWNLEMPHNSINLMSFVIAMAVINIVWDMAILGMVQGKVWGLHLDNRRKLLVSLLIILGAFSIVASIVRLVCLTKVDWNDPTYAFRDAGIWTSIESILYIICACLPVIYHLFRSKLGARAQRQTRSKESAQGLVTIGSSPPKSKRTNYADSDEGGMLNGSGYHVLCEPGPEGETHSMKSLDPVRVRNEIEVTRDYHQTA